MIRGNVDAVGDEEVVLGDRHRDAGDVGFLERVRADERAADLSGDGHDRNGVHLRVGERRHEVGRTGTGRRHTDAHLAGRLAYPVAAWPAPCS